MKEKIIKILLQDKIINKAIQLDTIKMDDLNNLSIYALKALFYPKVKKQIKKRDNLNKILGITSEEELQKFLNINRKGFSLFSLPSSLMNEIIDLKFKLMFS